MKKSYIYIILLLLTALFFLLDLFLGSVKIPLNEIVNILISKGSANTAWETIILDFRLPKTLTALLAGAALAVSGLQMQTLFRNPLAGPDVLGISSGASLGVALSVLGFSSLFAFQSVTVMGNWAIAIAAWVGSALVLLLIMSVSLRVRDIMTILILGIMFGAAASAFVSILQYFSSESLLKIFVVWTLGSLGGVTKSQLIVLVPSILAGLVLAFLSSKILNALLIGENYAKTMGVKIRSARLLVFLSTSLLSGTITAFCGPIGFIGIAIPHLARIIFRTADHSHLIPGTILAGGIVMLASDIISQLPGSGYNLPVNSVTALIGIPIIIWFIVKNYKIN